MTISKEFRPSTTTLRTNFVSFHNCERNIDSSQHSGIQAAIKTMIFSGKIVAEKTNLGLLAQKVMAIVFWEAHGIIHIDFIWADQLMASYMPTYLNCFQIWKMTWWKKIQLQRRNHLSSKSLFRGPGQILSLERCQSWRNVGQSICSSKETT